MSEETTNQQRCGGKKRAMLAYGLVQISATVVSAVSLAAIAVGLCAMKQESRLFNGCVETVVAEGPLPGGSRSLLQRRLISSGLQFKKRPFRFFQLWRSSCSQQL